MPNKIAGITRCEERKVNIVVKSEECPKHPGHKHSLIISINNNEGPTTRVDSECECGPSRLWSVLSKQNLIEATIALLMEKLEEFLAQLEPIATIAPVSEADDPGDPNSLDFPALTDALDSARRVREALELVLERITGDDET